MTVFLHVESGVIHVTSFVRDGKTRGRAMFHVLPGERFLGIPFDDLAKLGTGKHDIASRLSP